MARTVNRLTALQVSRATKAGDIHDGGGLYLQVSKSGAKSWIFRYWSPQLRKTRDMGLGSLSTISLAQAREEAARNRVLLRQHGVDPIEARDARRRQAALDVAKNITFKDAATRFIANKRAGWSNPKHAGQWTATLETYAYPVIGQLSVQSIDTGLVSRVLEPIWSTKSETASRVRGRIEAILDWAKAMGLRDGENPARWRGHLENVLPEKRKVSAVRHHKALPYTALPAFMAELRIRPDSSARALEFTVLTAARTNETIGAVRDEFDLVQKVWSRSAERMKAKKAHRVPLSVRAVEIVESMKHNHAYVFPGAFIDRPLSNMAMLELLRGMLGQGHTVHGFRSTFKDWCAEQTDYPNETSEIALAHTVSDKVEAAYRRGDMFEKRRAMMDDWARYCAGGSSR